MYKAPKELEAKDAWLFMQFEWIQVCMSQYMQSLRMQTKKTLNNVGSLL